MLVVAIWPPEAKRESPSKGSSAVRLVGSLVGITTTPLPVRDRGNSSFVTQTRTGVVLRFGFPPTWPLRLLLQNARPTRLQMLLGEDRRGGGKNNEAQCLSGGGLADYSPASDGAYRGRRRSNHSRTCRHSFSRHR